MLEFFQALVFSAALEFGVTNGSVVQYRPMGLSNEIPPTYAEFDFGAQYKHIFFDTSVRTDMFYKSITNWDPTQITFAIGGGIKINCVTIGFEHSCFHPMMTYSYATVMPEERQVVPGWEGSCDTLYIRIQIIGEPRKP